MVNKVTLVGWLGQDPEVRATNSGMSVANMSLATSYNKKGGEKTTEWHRLVAFDKTADIAAQYLQKGSLVFIEGRLQSSSWEDKDGNKRYKTEIIVADLKMLSSKQQKTQSSQSQNTGSNSDIPF